MIIIISLIVIASAIIVGLTYNGVFTDKDKDGIPDKVEEKFEEVKKKVKRKIKKNEKA
jgi:Tfp pilus assembly protein PilO